MVQHSFAVESTLWGQIVRLYRFTVLLVCFHCLQFTVDVCDLSVFFIQRGSHESAFKNTANKQIKPIGRQGRRDVESKRGVRDLLEETLEGNRRLFHPCARRWGNLWKRSYSGPRLHFLGLGFSISK